VAALKGFGGFDSKFLSGTLGKQITHRILQAVCPTGGSRLLKAIADWQPKEKFGVCNDPEEIKVWDSTNIWLAPA
jgi:hypothetical protein